MSDLNPELLQEQLAAAAARIIAFPRLRGRGYQGAIEVEDVEVVVRVRCADGQLRVIDPAEINDGHPDVFVRDFVEIGHRPGLSVVDFLERFLPLVSPRAATLWGSLKGLFGR